MNIPLVFVLLSLAYFGSSWATWFLQEKSAPADLYLKIVAVLEGMVQQTKYTSKVRPTLYRIWPVGIVGGILYDGSLACYIEKNEQTHTFKVSSFIYLNRSWQKIDEGVQSPSQFMSHMSSLLGLPASARQNILQKAGLPVPDHHPGHRTPPPW